MLAARRALGRTQLLSRGALSALFATRFQCRNNRIDRHRSNDGAQAQQDGKQYLSQKTAPSHFKKRNALTRCGTLTYYNKVGLSLPDAHGVRSACLKEQELAMGFYNLARDRYSERTFSTQPIEAGVLDQILEAGRLAPTARNMQPQRLLVVQSAEGLEKIDRCTKCRFGAPCVVVLAYDMTQASRNPDVADFGAIDTSIVATHMMLQAQELGVHSCWIGLIDPSELRRQFHIPKSYRIISVMDFGYPQESSQPAAMHEASKSIDDLVFYETFEAPEHTAS